MQRKEEHLSASGPLPVGAHGVGQNIAGTSSQFATPAVGSQATPLGYGGTAPITTAGVAQAPLYGSSLSVGQQAVYGQGNPMTSGVAPMSGVQQGVGVLPAAPVPGTTMAGEFGHDIPIVEPMKKDESAKAKAASTTTKDEKKGGFLSGLFGGNKDKEKHSEELHVRKDIATDKSGLVKETTTTKVERDNKTVFKDKDTHVIGQKSTAAAGSTSSASSLPLATSQTHAKGAELYGASSAMPMSSGSSSSFASGAPLSSSALGSSSMAGSGFIVRDVETTSSSSKMASSCPVHMVGATDIAGKTCVCTTTEGINRDIGRTYQS